MSSDWLLGIGQPSLLGVKSKYQQQRVGPGEGGAGAGLGPDLDNRDQEQVRPEPPGQEAVGSHGHPGIRWVETEEAGGFRFWWPGHCSSNLIIM